MSVSLTRNFLTTARGLTFTDGGGITWAINQNTNAITATATGGGGGTGANPTAKVGLAVVNGTATTFLRSDGSPPLDQTISPTMTGNWIFTPAATFTINTAAGIPVNITGGVAQNAAIEFAGNASTPGVGSMFVGQGADQQGYLFNRANKAVNIATNGITRIVVAATGLLQFTAYGAGTLISDASGNVTSVAAGPGAPTLAAAILADSPFAFWKLDDAAGAPQDSSGNGFHLTTTNGTVGYNQAGLIPTLPNTLFARIGTLTVGPGANGFQLTSQLGRTYPLLNWSAELVFCPIQNSGNYRIIDIRPAAATTSALTLLFVAGSGFEFFYPSTSNALTVAYLGPGTVHIAVTVSTAASVSTVTVYLNGAAINQYTAAASALTGTMIASIGDIAGSAAASSAFYAGYLALFPTTLSAARVAAHASAAGKLGI